MSAAVVPDVCSRCGMPLAYDAEVSGKPIGSDGLCHSCAQTGGRKRPTQRAMPPDWLFDLLLGVHMGRRPLLRRLAWVLAHIGMAPKLRQLGQLVLSMPPRDPSATYDAVVLYSGGKDSTYLLMQLAERKLRICAWMLNQGYQSPAALQNAELVCKRLGVDLVIDTPPKAEMIQLFRLGFAIDKQSKPELARSAMTYGSACWPCFATISARASKFLRAHKVRLCLIGTQAGQNRLDLNGRPVLEITELPRVDSLIDKFVHGFADHAAEQQLSGRDLLETEQAGAVLLPYYEFLPKPAPEEQISTISRMGWNMPKNTGACSSNCMINELGRHVSRRRFGFDLYQIIDANERRLADDGREIAAAPLDHSAVELGARLIALTDEERAQLGLGA